MTLSTIRRLITGAVAATTFIATAIGVSAQPAEAGGLRNCVEILGPQSGRVGCYELVWADGVQYRMTFSNQSFDGAAPQDLDPFYVLAPQSEDPQGYPPNTFGHDHVVRAIPAGNHGTYSAQLQGYFVFCTAEGLISGACVPTWTAAGGPDPFPFATTVNGHVLTSTEAIESAADDGSVALINLGPSAVIVGSISGR
jgi:hypothetical protein